MALPSGKDIDAQLKSTVTDIEKPTIDTSYGSYTTLGAKPSDFNPGLVLGNAPNQDKNALLFQPKPFSPEDSGRNTKVAGEGKPDDTGDNAQKKAKDEKKTQVPKNLKPDNPTAASQDKDKPILEAIMSADPGNIVGAVQKALQAMVMLKMMDKLTSPAGIAAMAAGGMGGALGALSGIMGGPGSMMNLMGAAMPALQGALPLSQLGAVNLGITGMLSGNPVGALAADAVQAAAYTASAIAVAKAASTPLGQTIATAAMLGGPALGLTPNSLAYTIALSTPGTVIRKSSYVNGIAINSTLEVVDPFIQNQLGDIPQLAGDEHVIIAQNSMNQFRMGMGIPVVRQLNAANIIGGVMADSLINGITSNIINPDLSNAAANILTGAGIGALLGGAKGAIGGALLGGVTGGVGGIVDAGLNSLLGGGLGDLGGMVGKLLPDIAGGITNVIGPHSQLGNLNVGAIGGLMNETTKALSLASKEFKIASVFGSNVAEQVADVHDSMLGNVLKNAVAGAAAGAAIGAAASALAPTTLRTVTNGVRITVGVPITPPAIVSPNYFYYKDTGIL
jgi:hypothetical protein